MDRIVNDPSNHLILAPIVDGGRIPASPSGELEICLNQSDLIRLYDGQPDPADASHLTIDYDINGLRGTIDGKLTPTGAVTLAPRTGRVVASGRTVCWSPTGAPMPTWANEISRSSTTLPTR